MDIKAIQTKIEELENIRVQPNVERETIECILGSIDFFDEKNVLEIGTFNGYSALWFATVADQVVTIEVIKESYDLAEKNLSCAENVKVILGNAFDVIEELKNSGEKFNVIFIDGKKEEYADYLEAVLDIVENDFIIFVDNTISHKDSLDGFFEHLKRYSDKLEWKETQLGKGLIVIKKKL
jgi:predicted O-methyltransferase YrrM